MTVGEGGDPLYSRKLTRRLAMQDLRAAERERGARRVDVRLEPEDLAALAVIRADLEGWGEPATDTAVIRRALGLAAAAIEGRQEGR
jgi:hypothetical protein